MLVNLKKREPEILQTLYFQSVPDLQIVLFIYFNLTLCDIPIHDKGRIFAHLTHEHKVGTLMQFAPQEIALADLKSIK